jgi:hypothetical protein
MKSKINKLTKLTELTLHGVPVENVELGKVVKDFMQNEYKIVKICYADDKDKRGLFTFTCKVVRA